MANEASGSAFKLEPATSPGTDGVRARWSAAAHSQNTVYQISSDRGWPQGIESHRATTLRLGHCDNNAGHQLFTVT